MQEVSSLQCQSTINKVLPEALSGYFFFDGEHISDINNKGNVVKAVRGLMGLETINEAVDHFSPRSTVSVISKLQKELDVGQDYKHMKLKSDLIDAKGRLQKFEERLAQVKSEIEYFEERSKELSDKILANADTKHRQEEKTRTERDVSFLERNQTAVEQEIVRDFTKNAYKFFALPLYDKVYKVIADAKQDGEGIPKMHSDSIEFILKRGKCICGADLTMNQGAVNHIRYEQSLLPPQHIGTTIREFKRDCQRYQSDITGYAERIQTDYRRIRENANELDDKKTHLAELSRLLQGNVDVGKFERDKVENDAQLKQRRDLEISISMRIGETKNQIESLEKQISALQLATDKNKRVNTYIAYAQRIYEWFRKSYDEKEKEVKDELYTSINTLFKQMYHGERIVEVDDKYHITLKVDSGNGVYVNDTSPGLDTVKNFAFIAGIVDLARKKAQQKGDGFDAIEYSSEPYPIVMDAPFSNADEKHIANISKVLPQVAEQVILVVMNKDWEYSQANMSDKVGMIYQIEKHSEVNSSIRRND
jgi:DNA sulfur modification protein DndD